MHLLVDGVTKTFPNGFQALAGVSLGIERGLHGLLGPNGAGKTTLMRILTTLLEPTSGRVMLDGRDLATCRGDLRRQLGYLGQEWGAPRSSRCAEVLDLVLRLRGMDERARRRSEIDRLLSLVGLQANAKSKVKTLSGGMLRRLGVAQALAGDPQFLVMDEPTVGLDPDERVEFRRLLVELGRERTILLSTHVVADVGTTCGRVSVMAKGRLVFDGPPDELRALAAGKVFETVATPEQEQRLRRTMTVVSAVPGEGGARLHLVGAPPGDIELRPIEPSLEDAYLVLVPQVTGDDTSWAA